jgi:diguanylate cyclase (GGDEF)-like protein/PAS domain S-box-containing protein
MLEEEYRTILDQLEDGVYFVDRDRRITYWNPGAERITGYSAQEVISHSCSEGILRHVSEGGQQLCVNGCPLWAVMDDGRPREARVYLHHKRGHRVPVTVKGNAIRNSDGEIVGSVEVFHRRLATRFADPAQRDPGAEAYLDPLTELGNRRFGQMHVQPVLDALETGATTLGLLFIDVDHFKTINDTHGHSVGDAVLRMVGQTLAHGLRTSDWPIRWGGEEFVALLPGISPDTLDEVAERLRMLVENSWLEVHGQQVKVTISVGATMVDPGESFEVALTRADRRMYDSKTAGRNVVTGEQGPVPRRGPAPTVGLGLPSVEASG